MVTLEQGVDLIHQSFSLSYLHFNRNKKQHGIWVCWIPGENCIIV